MADTDTYAKHKLLKTEENRANPSKFYASFLCKALIVSICLVFFPLFPSQAPEFINQTLLTRSWELLHLVFVGIAVSYGLFSHRNDEIEIDNNNHSKFDNAQTYVSRFLQVSSVFDDENENLSGSDENKVQTWSNQYYRNEPVVIVAKEHSVLDQEQRVTGSTMGEKPLLLPIRRLKSRAPDSDTVEASRESNSLNRPSSNSSSRRYSSNSNKRKNGELGGFDHANLDERLNENVVLPSPIPWRSRSGRMELKEGVDSSVSALNSMSPSMEEPEFTRVESRSLRPQMPRSSRPNSTSSSPKMSSSPSLSSPRKLSPPPSLSSESQIKNSDDFVKKKSFYRPPPPPPPPPPPLQVMQKSASMRASSSLNNNEASFEKNLKRSFTAETMELNMGRGNSGVEIKAKGNLDGFSMGKSVRTMRTVDMGIKDKEIEDGVSAKSERRHVTFDQSSFKTEQLRRETINFMPNPTYMEFPKQEKEEFVDKVVVETDEDSESEDDDYDDTGETPFVSNAGRSSNNDEAAASNSANDGGPDVDKKADEFIAKFREQIRLQRIESIKRSSAQISRNSPR